MENEKQVFVQLSISQLEILERGLDYAILGGIIYNHQKRKAEKLQSRLLKEIEKAKDEQLMKYREG